MNIRSTFVFLSIYVQQMCLQRYIYIDMLQYTWRYLNIYIYMYLSVFIVFREIWMFSGRSPWDVWPYPLEQLKVRFWLKRKLQSIYLYFFTHTFVYTHIYKKYILIYTHKSLYMCVYIPIYIYIYTHHISHILDIKIKCVVAYRHIPIYTYIHSSGNRWESWLSTWVSDEPSD